MVELRKSNWETLGGLPIPAYHAPNNDVERPGHPPYTRGIHESMYRSRLWTMRQYAGFSSAKETNERFQLLLERGQKGLSVAFDLPTQLGLDADDPLSEGEVGKVGVSISCLQDMRDLFADIPLDKVSTSMTINAPAMVLLAMYCVVAEEQGVSSEKISGTIQNDILKEYIARGTYVFPPEHSMRLITDIFEYCSMHIPKWNTISISGYHIREAGSTAVQELAFTLSNALAYVESACAKGLDVDTFAPRLSFFFNCHNDFLEEVSKFRAARRLWHDLMVERYSPTHPRSSQLRFHTQVAGVSLTAQQPYNNISRVTIQALAAVCGGTQSLHTNSFDEALGLPTEDSATIALRTQQIIAEESGVADVVDPFAGSYHIEALTNEIYDKCRMEIEKIESMGGALRAIEQGYQQQEIHSTAYRYFNEIERGTRRIVGVNHGTMEEKVQIKPMKLNPEVAEHQKLRLDELRKKRNESNVREILATITDASKARENLFPLVLEAVRENATLGEIMQAMKDVFGTYSAPSGF
ncbi:MAG: Methylmalonyl-CoA mutase large subunit [Candidatus Poseidoniaceae archaeon]|nr:MAG: Methylmalonyl-CoA mutase large subunit [Candidatus Poseidoniaceae archaeon]